ncbi:MAG: hypothetical protein J6X28_06015 [Bacilli bacterium]|nr:hypothetical protein [Bacilli bacterium]
MNELMDKIDNLKNELDSSSLVLDIKEIQKKIRMDSHLMGLLEEYSVHPRDEIKSEILESNLFQEYKLKETELNLFIMEMNQRLKVISKKGKCNHESH